MSTRVEIPPCGTIGEGADPRRWLTLAVVLLADVDFRLQGRIAQRIERVVESAAVEVRERDFAASIERPLLRGRRVPAQLSAAEEGPRRLARAADHRGRALMVRPASFMFGCTTPVYGEETLPTSFPGECLTSRRPLRVTHNSASKLCRCLRTLEHRFGENQIWFLRATGFRSAERGGSLILQVH